MHGDLEGEKERGRRSLGNLEKNHIEPARRAARRAAGSRGRVKWPQLPFSKVLSSIQNRRLGGRQFGSAPEIPDIGGMQLLSNPFSHIHVFSSALAVLVIISCFGRLSGDFAGCTGGGVIEVGREGPRGWFYEKRQTVLG